ncbi:hypothetical protein DFJ74DRAFT_775267 [Hyaloraphidium curvatum]|nr:hypothetical protein DFJ74DRAFT_775267 [Hyaloraphidium curvatum]
MPSVAYASITWNSPWAAALCTAFAALAVEYTLVNVLAGARANVVAIQLALRLHRRASTLALRGLFVRYRTLASAYPSYPPPEELYLLLQDALGRTWPRTRIQRVTSGPSLAIAFPLNAVVVAAARLALGNCLPAVSLNTHVSVISSLLGSARGLLRRARCEFDKGTAGSDAAQHIAAHHDRLILAFLTPRTAALPSSWASGSARNVAATALTPGIGLWSILRGGGVQVTLYPTCW